MPAASILFQHGRQSDGPHHADYKRIETIMAAPTTVRRQHQCQTPTSRTSDVPILSDSSLLAARSTQGDLQPKTLQDSRVKKHAPTKSAISNTAEYPSPQPVSAPFCVVRTCTGIAKHGASSVR
ncbi:hypothetical protein BD779DRAFT_293269 [Infundibulicybe gibba]|nr:hypothetical protein BD779DRAFT_293269 [Infundibulicybe gibba]